MRRANPVARAVIAAVLLLAGLVPAVGTFVDPRTGLPALLIIAAQSGLLAGALLLLLPPSRLAAWMWIPAVLPTLLLGARTHLGLIDDAYISLRYAGNWAAGLGPVWNPGERVEGYTSFLWVLLLAASRRIGSVDLERAGLTLSLASAVLLLWSTGRLTRRIAGLAGQPERVAAALGAAGAVVLALHWPFTFWAWSGMESLLSVALLTLHAECFLWWLGGERRRDRPLIASCVALGVATITRPESYAYGALFLCALGAAAPRSQRSGLLWRAAGILAAFAVPHLVFRLAYYGDLLPNTFYAKVDFSSWSLLGYAARYLLAALPVHLPYLVGGAIGLARLYASSSASGRTAALYLAALVGMQLGILLYTGGDHFIEQRFLLPVVPMCLALLLAGLALPRHVVEGDRAPRPRLVRPILGAWIVGALSLAAAFSRLGPAVDSTVQYGRSLTRRWVHAGDWLRQHAEPGDWLATPVAGAIPFRSGLRTIDMVGLNDRHIARRPARLGGVNKDHEKYDTAYVLGRRPDWIYIGPFAAPTLARARAQCAAFPFYLELIDALPEGEYELVSGRDGGVAFTFLHRVRN